MSLHFLDSYSPCEDCESLYVPFDQVSNRMQNALEVFGIISGSFSKNLLCRVAIKYLTSNQPLALPPSLKAATGFCSIWYPDSGRPGHNGISACTTKRQH